MSRHTVDTFFNGRIRVVQDRTGYRFSIDAVLLADHVQPRVGDTVVDLGTGCGIIPLILAYRHPGVDIFGVEVQEDVAAIAKQNVVENRQSARIHVFCQDMKQLPFSPIPNPVDWVITNPPYRKVNAGRLNPNRQRAVARHEILVTLRDVVAVARRMLKTGGKFLTVYPVERLVDVLTEMRTAGVEPKNLRMIHSKRKAPAKLVLVEGAKRVRPGVIAGPPLVIYREDGTYTGEVAGMFDK